MTVQSIDLSNSTPLTKRSISQLPINLFASVMGITGLSLAWREATRTIGLPALPGEYVGWLGTSIFLSLALGYAIKWRRHPGLVAAEFAHPVQSNFFATVAIGLLLQSAFLNLYSPLLSEVVWTIASALTFALAYVVARGFLGRQQSRDTTLPPLLIPGVATLDIAVTGHAMPFSWAHEVNMLAFSVGSVIAAVFIALIGCATKIRFRRWLGRPSWFSSPPLPSASSPILTSRVRSISSPRSCSTLPCFSCSSCRRWCSAPMLPLASPGGPSAFRLLPCRSPSSGMPLLPGALS